MKIKAVVFDLDNTLYEYPPCHKAGLTATWNLLKKKKAISWKKFLVSYSENNHQNETELFGTAASHNRLLYFQRMLHSLHIPFDAKFILALEDTYWIAFFKKMTFSKDVKKTIQWCKKNKLKLGLLSDLTSRIQFKKLIKLGLQTTFDAVVTSEQVGVEKPHTKGFFTITQMLNVKPFEAIMIGDNPRNDIVGASRIGMQTILIKRKDMAHIKGASATYTTSSFSQILSILRKLA